MHPIARVLAVLTAATLPASEARAADPVAAPSAPADSGFPTPSPDPPPQNGFTCGLHFGLGFALVEAVPGEQHIFATTAGFRAGYRFAPWFAVYGDLTGHASIGGVDFVVVSDGVKHPRPQLLSAIPILSVPLAFRPIRFLELSAAPALGAYQIPVYSGEGPSGFSYSLGTRDLLVHVRDCRAARRRVETSRDDLRPRHRLVGAKT